MPVTDEQVAPLRAALRGDVDEFRRLNAQQDQEAAKTGFATLVSCAFIEAVDRHFTNRTTDFEIAQYVADVRARSDGLAHDLDPIDAEAVVRSATGRTSTDSMKVERKFKAQFLLLGALVSDLELDDRELEIYLAEARRLADQLLEQRGK